MKTKILSIQIEDDQAQDDLENVAYWVTALIGGRKYKLYGKVLYSKPGKMQPNGQSFQDWCDERLIERYGYEQAYELGREALAQARLE